MGNQMLWLLVGDWSIVGGVGCNDSLRVHHFLTSQVGLAHFPQADWRWGWRWEGHIQEMLSRLHALTLSKDRSKAEHSVHDVVFDLCPLGWCKISSVKYLSSCVRDSSPGARFCLTTVDARSLSTNRPARHIKHFSLHDKHMRPYNKTDFAKVCSSANIHVLM